MMLFILNWLLSFPGRRDGLSLITLLSVVSLSPSRILISQRSGESSTGSLIMLGSEVPPLVDITKAVKLIA